MVWILLMHQRNMRMNIISVQRGKGSLILREGRMEDSIMAYRRRLIG
jgi:hypothetical protein